MGQQKIRQSLIFIGAIFIANSWAMASQGKDQVSPTRPETRMTAAATLLMPPSRSRALKAPSAPPTKEAPAEIPEIERSPASPSKPTKDLGGILGPSAVPSQLAPTDLTAVISPSVTIPSSPPTNLTGIIGPSTTPPTPAPLDLTAIAPAAKKVVVAEPAVTPTSTGWSFKQ